MTAPSPDLAWNTTPSDLIDWTITAAPDPDELVLSGPAPAASPRPIFLSRRGWAILLGALALTTVILWSIPAFTWYRTQLNIQQIIALADQPSEMPAPIAPLRALRWRPGTARLHALTALDSERVSAEVARQFTAPTGEIYTFLSTEFYHFTDKTWERTPTPDGYWGEPLHRQSGHLHWIYYAADTNRVNALVTRMDDVVSALCAVGECPVDAFLTLNLTGRGPRNAEALDIAPGDPFLFVASPPHLKRWPHYTLIWPAPQAWGRPADDATAAFLERAYATQLLFALADWQVFHQRIDAVGNVFFYALVIRRSAAVGLDSETLRAATAPLPASAYTLDELWNTRFSVWNRFDAIRTALALTNELLRDQPPEVEHALFRALPATDVVTWAATGLNISQAEAQARLDAAWKIR